MERALEHSPERRAESAEPPIDAIASKYGSWFGKSTSDPTGTATTRGVKVSLRWRMPTRVGLTSRAGASFRKMTTLRTSDGGASVTAVTVRFGLADVGRLAVDGVSITTRPCTDPGCCADEPWRESSVSTAVPAIVTRLRTVQEIVAEADAP